MRLSEFLALEQVEEAYGDLNKEITGLTYDSRKASAGQIFFAIPGEKFDGHDFISDVLGRGAAAVVLERDEARAQGGTWIRVKNTRRSMGLWGAHFFGRPSDRLKIAGVTGTNGKTTITYLLESIFSEAGIAPGVIGTISYRYKGREIPSHHTTPESLDIQALLAEMHQAGVGAVAIEASSHALAQERVRGLEFDVGIFTNLSRDHLDYHRDMDDYFAAKSKLFTDYLKNSSKKKKAAVIHGGDPRGEELLKKVRDLGLDAWSYGRDDKWDVHPEQIRTDVRGVRGTLRVKQEQFDFSSSLIGSANLENILSAVAAGFALGLPNEAVLRGIAAVKSVPGRVEKVENHLGISIVVDYAHTPDALEKVLSAVRPLTQKRVIALFGCGGDRDRGKRPLMGEIAARLADLVVLTSDNPRTEDPVKILQEVEAGVQKAGLQKLATAGPDISNFRRGYCVAADRREAIQIALEWARPGDLVLLAGKGHEDYQIIGTNRIRFDDREVAREEASRRANASTV